jgi:hypothetical protein
LENSNFNVSGAVGFATAPNSSMQSRISFVGPLSIACDVSDTRSPCAQTRNISFQGKNITFELDSRSLGYIGTGVESERSAILSGDVKIFYSLPSFRETIRDQPSLHFGWIPTTSKCLCKVNVSLANYRATFDFNPSKRMGFNVVLRDPGSYRVPYQRMCTDVFAVSVGKLSFCGPR